ncbi:MAG: hypothetical protein IMZ50_16435 [Candidatus Atribacteria bacterium]|nr:hypothetical protein [Candidatus Atribacteria bacterium]
MSKPHNAADFTGDARRQIDAQIAAANPVMSRSVQRRLAAQMGNPAPDFSLTRFEFTVPGHPRGAVRTTRRGNWTPAAKSYHEYMNGIRAAAAQASLPLPLEAKETPRVTITTRPYSNTGTHSDADNIWKAVVDSLCYGGSGDKHIDCVAFACRRDARERIEVTVEWTGGGA